MRKRTFSQIICSIPLLFIFKKSHVKKHKVPTLQKDVGIKFDEDGRCVLNGKEEFGSYEDTYRRISMSMCYMYSNGEYIVWKDA